MSKTVCWRSPRLLAPRSFKSSGRTLTNSLKQIVTFQLKKEKKRNTISIHITFVTNLTGGGGGGFWEFRPTFFKFYRTELDSVNDNNKGEMVGEGRSHLCLQEPLCTLPQATQGGSSHTVTQESTAVTRVNRRQGLPGSGGLSPQHAGGRGR